MCLSKHFVIRGHLDTKFLGAKFHGTHRAIPNQLDKANVFVPRKNFGGQALEGFLQENMVFYTQMQKLLKIRRISIEYTSEGV